MGLFNFLKPKSRPFLNEANFRNSRDTQKHMTPKTLEQLRKIGVNEVSELKLEYFFYTNTADKAELLAAEIAKLGYDVQFGVSASDKKLFIITGWTNKMKMSDEVVTNWTVQMCDLGYQFDCEFDGWGTTPDQI
ncbi:ribonuclease E inhibitor RraB [Fluviicola sp.]|uniref:ribonuclease E inhibitor RraB n=1 Tax=Fluviicola sp. TaxID=1917219 RepID=UPI0031DCC201